MTDRAYKVGVLLRRILTVAMWFPGLAACRSEVASYFACLG